MRAHSSNGVFTIAILLALVAEAGAQGFGRFGYVDALVAPGLEITKAGFRTHHPASDTVRFEMPSTIWRPVQTSEYGQIVGLSGGSRSPLKARADLFEPGVALYYANGVGLGLSCLSSPYLSWAEGSVGPGVPTPKVPWVLLTFRDAQPPLMLVFLDGPAAVSMSGRTGDWVVRTESLYRGWVRVVTSLGLRAKPTNRVADLGEVVQATVKQADVWTRPTPKLIEVRYQDDATAVTATWRFDGPGARVPAPVILAPFGGYPLKLQSAVRRLEGADEAGPIAICEEAELTVRFPVRRVPTGRGLGVGRVRGTPLGSVSSIDLPSVVELALQNLASARDAMARKAVVETLDTFLGEATYAIEPHTNQRLPFGADGKAIDLVAAHALLMQSRDTAERASSEANSLLTSLAWRRDWHTWRIWGPDAVVARRTGALAAVAGAICPEPLRRLDAAMFEAGIAAERGLPVWRRRVLGESSDPPSLIEPLDSIRAELFFRIGTAPAPLDPFVRLVLSELRVFGETGVTALATPHGIELTWHAEAGQRAQVIVASAYPLAVGASRNLREFKSAEALGFTTLRGTADADGECAVVLKPPEWAQPLPMLAELPRYGETRRR